MNKVIIKLQNVNLSYFKKMGLWSFEHNKILRDLSFEIYKGETVGIIGRNGAGKSSLLRLLAGIVEPDSGYIKRNKDIPMLMTLHMGFEPQLNGYENIIFSGMLMGYTKEFIIDKIDNIENFSELGNSLKDPVRIYSTGMKARLAFSICAILDTKIMLLDEVLSVGDESFRKKSIIAIKEKILSNNTVIIASHSLLFLEEICGRVLWLDNGVINDIGDPSRVIHNYRNQNIQDNK